MGKYGSPEPIENQRLRAVGDDEEIDLGRGATLRALWTPGHASHHLSYQWEGTGVIFTGDAVGINYPAFPALVPTTPPTSFNLEQSVQSLERIRNTSPTEFLTPHYGVMRNAEQMIGENVKALHDWKTRIEKMVKGSSSVDELVKTLTEETSQRAGRPLTEVPEYLRISIKVSVLGFLRYLGHTEPVARSGSSQKGKV
jgi:glyoxylase-like metal-dependent hydrolase (beta-lactamase superfamily II)